MPACARGRKLDTPSHHMVQAGPLLLGYSGERSQEQCALQIKRWFEDQG